LNTILYGPPGCGKTYDCLYYTLAIIEQKPIVQLRQENREALQRRFQLYREQQQIEQVSFHQSFSYEDFVQGLGPNIQAGNLVFEKRDGIFKRLADRALKNFDRFRKQKKRSPLPFEDLLNLVLSGRINPETEEIEIPLEVNHRIYKSIIIFDLSEEALIYRRRTKNDIVKDEARKLLFHKLESLYLGQEIKEAINKKYYQAVIELVRQQEENLVEEEQVALKNYVIIIDEINRAPVSRVFGELISLLETDKRYGAPAEMQVSLPSGENFVLPPNIYVLATMNSSDKSVAPMDYALRRRFSFIGLYPRPELVKDQLLRHCMQGLNQELLRELKSPDYLIGQAYFMNKDKSELESIINQHII
ncbi:MAG: AAA family ATPase, partial [Bacteroidota bacterium]